MDPLKQIDVLHENNFSLDEQLDLIAKSEWHVEAAANAAGEAPKEQILADIKGTSNPLENYEAPETKIFTPGRALGVGLLAAAVGLVASGCAGVTAKDTPVENKFFASADNTLLNQIFGTDKPVDVQAKIDGMITSAVADEKKWPEVFAAISLIEGRQEAPFQNAVAELNKKIDAFAQNYGQTNFINAPAKKVVETLVTWLNYSNLRAGLDQTFVGDNTMKPVMEYVSLGGRIHSMDAWVKRDGDKLKKLVVDLYASGDSDKGVAVIDFKDDGTAEKIGYHKDSEKAALTEGSVKVNSQSMVNAGSQGYSLEGKLVTSEGGQIIDMGTNPFSQEAERILQEKYGIFTEPTDEVELFAGKESDKPDQVNQYAKVSNVIVKLEQSLLYETSLAAAIKGKDSTRILQLSKLDDSQKAENKTAIDQYVRAMVNANPMQEVAYGWIQTFERSSGVTGVKGHALEAGSKPLFVGTLADLYAVVMAKNPDQATEVMLGVLGTLGGNAYSKEDIEGIVSGSATAGEALGKVGGIIPSESAEVLRDRYRISAPKDTSLVVRPNK